VLVRGEQGEIKDAEIRYLKDHRTPITWSCSDRMQAERQPEGYISKASLPVTSGSTKTRSSRQAVDDEIAVATCLEKMAAYARGGPDFYSLAEASQDHFLSLMIDKSLASGVPVETLRQPWAS